MKAKCLSNVILTSTAICEGKLINLRSPQSYQLVYFSFLNKFTIQLLILLIFFSFIPFFIT